MLRLEEGHTAAENKADEIIYFLCGIIASMNFLMKKHISPERASGTERTSKVVKDFHRVKNAIQNIVAGYTALGDDPLVRACFIPTHDVYLLRCVDAAPGDDSSAVPRFDETNCAYWSRCKNIFLRLRRVTRRTVKKPSRCKLGLMFLLRFQNIRLLWT